MAEGGLLLHSIPLSDIETVTQKSSFLSGNPLLVIQVSGAPATQAARWTEMGDLVCLGARRPCAQAGPARTLHACTVRD